ncbi:CyP450 monooxygenase [Rhizoctonia solani]|nr:CyP450 monooxygenase [Rhizoctonia solani]
MWNTLTILWAALVLTPICLASVGKFIRRNRRHPPSPLSLPFIGNVFSIPSGLEHISYMKIGEQLKSDVIFLEVLGQRIIVLNSAQAASELLDQRSRFHSDRYCPPMIKDPKFDWSDNVGMVEYGDIFRHHRRMMSNWMNPRVTVRFHPIQENHAQYLLQRFLELQTNPDPLEETRTILFYTVAAFAMHAIYGYRLKGTEDAFLKEAKIAVDHVVEAGMFTSGYFLVNIIPALAYVPDWFPGADWKRVAREWRAQKDAAINAPFEWTKSQVAAGVAEPSLLNSLLQDHNLTSNLTPEENDRRLKELGITLFAGKSNRTTSILVGFIAAMVLNPKAQERAQREMDAVLGEFTLPRISDRERLPYVNNLILEVLRWRPMIPTGVPHVCFQDDEYRGYKISKGTIIMGNVWAMSCDRSVYQDPEVFNPDRFSDPVVPSLPIFGWGRRKCPGKHLAESLLFISIASLLSCFTFSRKRDAGGNEIIPEIEYTSNAIIL